MRARREQYLSWSQEMHHYTSLAGFKGIIEENGFWASDNRFMNDAEESWNGIKLARRILQHKAKRSNDEGFRGILLKVEELLASPDQYGHLIVCFTTARDDLGQWRGYGAGGVCLCLGERRAGESPVFFGPEHLPHEAIYDEVRKRTILLSIVRSFEQEYVRDRAVMGERWPYNHDQNYFEFLHLKIASSIVGFKDRAFKNEAEARLVLSHKNADRYEGGLRFRVSPLGIIPYLRTGDHTAIKSDGGRLPLHEVIIGPAPHQELVAKSLETFLKHHGYSDTKISLSKVPYRTSQ